MRPSTWPFTSRISCKIWEKWADPLRVGAWRLLSLPSCLHYSQNEWTHTLDICSWLRFWKIPLKNDLGGKFPMLKLSFPLCRFLSWSPGERERFRWDYLTSRASSTWRHSSEHNTETLLSLQGKTQSGPSSPSPRTRTPTATGNSSWRGRGTASMSASSCATRSGTRSTWATRSTVSPALRPSASFGSWFDLGAELSSFVSPPQGSSTTSGTSPASARTTVSSWIRSWTGEQAGTSEPTSSSPDWVNIWFHGLLAGVWKYCYSCDFPSGSRWEM